VCIYVGLIWSEFSECSTTCGTGVQISTRTCSNPAKEHNGRDCEGEASSVKSCDNKDACALNVHTTLISTFLSLKNIKCVYT
jgi:hypothetical protein